MFKEMNDLFQWAWLIPFLPFLSFLLIALVTKRSKRLSSTISILAILTSFGLSIAIGLGVIQSGSQIVENPVLTTVNWLSIGGLHIDFGTLIDPMSAMMLFVVSLVASMVQIYSIGYMHGDPGFSRYYAFQSLFAASMLGMVIATNLLQLFIFWELVGLCSYLLIGFWFHKVSAREAAKKAFITTRVGDFGLLLGILFLYNTFGTLDFYGPGSLSVQMATSFHDVCPDRRRKLSYHHGNFGLHRTRWEIRSVPLARLAAGCHGRSYPRQCLDPRRYHGCGRGLSGGADVLPL